ncbi:MAG: phage portal protein [Opitutaceae bacterium]|jgi:hypothetical protein
MAQQLLDSFGRTAVYQSSANIYESSDEDGTRLSRPDIANDIALLLSRVKHRALLSDSRYIASTFSVVGGAVKQKADYVCQAGFSPHFSGSDKVYAKIARAATINAHKVINVRGRMFSWNKGWEIACMLLDIDGSIFILLGKTASGYPQIQCLEAHRIGCRYGETQVDSGTYKGLRILNGIIYNGLGREVAYRVLAATSDDDKDISARDMIHVADPRWFSDGRPFPALASAILDWYDVKETRSFQKTKAKINAAVTLIEETEDGKAPADAARDAVRQGKTTVDQNGRQISATVTMLAKGMIRYVKSGGGSVKAHQDNTPGDSVQKFDQTLVSGAFYGMGWRYEMMDPATLAGAATRGFQDQINTAIFGRWGALVPFVMFVEAYVIACLTQIGEIPEHPEWLQFGYIPPADFTVDGGRSSQADLNNIRAGTDTNPAIIGRWGRTAEEVLREQAEYLKTKKDIEDEFSLPPGSLGTLNQPGLTLQLPDQQTPASNDKQTTP